MIKKYYYALISMKYAFFMFGLPVLVFVLAFLETKMKFSGFHYLMMVLAILLFIVLFFYYKDKMKVSKQLKKVSNLVEYSYGGVVDRSWILENRMLCCKDLEIHEVLPEKVSAVKEETIKNKVILHLYVDEKIVDMSALSEEEAQRFCAFLKRKNPDIALHGIEIKGKGTLQELGASAQV